LTAYFFDTSAIVKRFATEIGHQWIESLHHPSQQADLFISQAALVEVVSAFCQKERQGVITREERNDLITIFRTTRQKTYNMVRVTNAIYQAAGDLCTKHRLRAYDAVQLACALAVRDNDPNTILSFVCADNALLIVAATEGLAIENPNLHP
jgi:uncharacterized protein